MTMALIRLQPGSPLAFIIPELAEGEENSDVQLEEQIRSAYPECEITIIRGPVHMLVNAGDLTDPGPCPAALKLADQRTALCDLRAGHLGTHECDDNGNYLRWETPTPAPICADSHVREIAIECAAIAMNQATQPGAKNLGMRARRELATLAYDTMHRQAEAVGQ